MNPQRGFLTIEGMNKKQPISMTGGILNEEQETVNPTPPDCV